MVILRINRAALAVQIINHNFRLVQLQPLLGDIKWEVFVDIDENGQTTPEVQLYWGGAAHI